MGQFLRVNGDYNIKCAEGSRITLDTGPGTGEVRITGDLLVEGDTTTVQAENLNVEDNIIVLNIGETGAGITLGYAGIQIDRGTLAPVGLFYDETADAWLLAQGGPAVTEDGADTPFSFTESRLQLKEILTDSSIKTAYVDDVTEVPGGRFGDLNLIGTGNGTVTVFGTINYEDQVVHDDDIPNKRYVDDSILNNPTFQIVAPQSEDTKVVIADKDITPNAADQPGSLAYFTDTTTYTTNGESAVSIIVDNELVAQFYDDYVLVGNPGSNGIEIDGTNFEIRTEASVSDQNIFIKTVGTGKLQTNYALQLDKLPSLSGYVSGSTLVYAKELDIGQSGVWFRNDSSDSRVRDGELISKDKALVFSILF